MKHTLSTLYNYSNLTEAEAYNAMQQIVEGRCNEFQTTSFLSAYIMRKPTPAELSGFRATLMDYCQPLTLDNDAIDIVGTGGDEKNTFNISTLSAVIVAAAGYKVIRHGNYAASSVCGSSNLLEYFGYQFSRNQSDLQRQLDETNFCYLHAPLFHTAMQNVAVIRKNLGIRTFFNLLGPLINPARPAKLLLGVSSLEIARTYNYLLQTTQQKYTIVHSLDGYDEISLTAPFKIISANSEEIVDPADIGLSYVLPELITTGNTIKEAALTFANILKGKGSKEQMNVVITNSGFAIRLFHPEKALSECISIAREALLSLKALKIFKLIIN